MGNKENIKNIKALKFTFPKFSFLKHNEQILSSFSYCHVIKNTSMQDFNILVFQGKGRYRITDSCVVTDEGPMQVEIINQHAFIGDKTPLKTATRDNTKWIEFAEKLPWKSLEVDDKFHALWDGPMLANGFFQYDGRQYVSETKGQEEERHKRMKDKEFALPIDISKISRITVRGGVDVVMSVSKISDDFITDVLEGAKFCSSVKKAYPIAPSCAPNIGEVGPLAWSELEDQISWFAGLPALDRKCMGRWVAVCGKRIIADGACKEEIREMSRERIPGGIIYIADNIDSKYGSGVEKTDEDKEHNPIRTRTAEETGHWSS